MAWIESHQEIRNHPKTVRLKRRLGVGTASTIGHLHMFWWWALSYAEDGDISRFEDEIIADACDWDGDPCEFVAALVASGWVNEDRTIHDWDNYTGRIRKQRADNRARQQRWREANALGMRRHSDAETRNALLTRESPLDNPATGPNRTGPDLTGQVPPLASQESPAADAAASPKRTSKGKTKAPDVLEPNEADLAAGAELGMSPQVVAAKASAMLDHFRARGEMRSDWHATLRTWLRNAPKFDRPASRASPSLNGRTPAPVSLDTETLFSTRYGSVVRR